MYALLLMEALLEDKRIYRVNVFDIRNLVNDW